MQAGRVQPNWAGPGAKNRTKGWLAWNQYTERPLREGIALAWALKRAHTRGLAA